MPGSALLRIVVDTNVVFEGLTKQGGASGLIVGTGFLSGDAMESSHRQEFKS